MSIRPIPFRKPEDRPNMAAEAARLSREVLTAEENAQAWDDQFAAICGDLHKHHQKIWNELAGQIPRLTFLNFLCWIITWAKGDWAFQWLADLATLTLPYVKRYQQLCRDFEARLKAEDTAASKFAVPPETEETRQKLEYGGNENAHKQT